MNKDEALRKAIDVFEEIQSWYGHDKSVGQLSDYMYEAKCLSSVTANELRQALAQPEPEPVAWRTFDGEGEYQYRSYENNEDYGDWWSNIHPNHRNWVEPLYTRPKEWQDLTDEEYQELHLQLGPVYFYQDYGRAIEAKLKEKNT